ncbi:hypothetical protein KAT80_00010 [Candidatus Pacearchaeota archaeon]|nr:hypothetical protein [Candidatus Pacearchaeota archaeon]
MEKKKSKKKKLVLHSIGNLEKFNYNYYIFDKKQKVIEKLAKILIMDLNIEIDLYEKYKDKKGKWESRKINFKKVKDEHYGLQGYSVDIRCDLFFGDKKIFVTLNCSNEDRLKFNEILFKSFDMPKSKSSKNVKKTKKNKILGPFKHNKNFLKKSKTKKQI